MGCSISVLSYDTNADEYRNFITGHQTAKICLSVVRKDGTDLKHVGEQTEEICLAAVKQNGHALRFVQEQTPKICIAAVTQSPDVLAYVDKQTPEICLAAVRQDGNALQFVKEQTPALCLIGVRRRGKSLAFVKEQNPAICLLAVLTDGEALQFVKEQTPEICLAAVNQHGSALQFVKEQTPEICLAAMKREKCLLKFVKNQTFDICLAAVKACPLDVQYVREPLKEGAAADGWRPTVEQYHEICLTAMRRDDWAFSCIKEPSIEICRVAANVDNPVISSLALKTMAALQLLVTVPEEAIQAATELHRAQEVTDPLTMEAASQGQVFGFKGGSDAPYPVASLDTINNLIRMKYKGSTKEAVFSPLHNERVSVADLVWVRF